MNKIRARPVSDPPGALRATDCRPEPTSSVGVWPREGDDTPRSCNVDPDFPGNPTGNTRIGVGSAARVQPLSQPSARRPDAPRTGRRRPTLPRCAGVGCISPPVRTEPALRF